MNKLKHFLYLLLLAITVQSCSESTTSQISGKLDNLDTNKLLLVYDDPQSKVDSIFINTEKFFYTFSPDTITLLRLVNKDGQYIPLFADRGWETKVEGTFAQPIISGKGPNKDYQDFLEIIANKPKSEYAHEAIKFVHNHPDSYASAYIIHKYLIDIDKPNSDSILKAIKPLYGAIKDTRILSLHKGSIKENKKDNHVPYFTFKDRNNKSVHIYTKDFKYTLINFWASWDKESCEVHDSLYSTLKSLKNKDIRIICHSLDYNKQEWTKACKNDSPNWIETSDFRGWNNSILESEDVKCLPANILIDRDRNIIGRNLYGDKLTDKIKELTKTKKDK